MNMERDFRYTDLLSKGYYFDTITAPDFNHLLAIVDGSRKAIYCNRDAKPDANMISLVFRHKTW
jgi:hypothetical protein